ncbi:MAG TPA: EamA family transporter [Patescibacteria group bacterium]|nr:EamA family transporter [Patescibacteria group bacterium]
MESWFLFALISALLAGLYSFTTRLSAHYQHHSALVSVYSSISAAVLSGGYAIFVRPDLSRVGLVFIIALVDAFMYLMVSVTRIDALKEINSTIFFPIYKLASSVLAVPIGLLFFADVLTKTELVGIAVGLLAPLLLLNRGEKLRQRNLSKGLLLTMGSVAAAIVATIASKLITTLHLDVSLYTFFAFALSVPFALVLFHQTNGRFHKTKHVEWVGLLGGAFMFANLYCFVRALSGDLSTVFLINSFSTVVVVILSVLAFREHMSLRKVGALAVTILSLILLK